MKIKLLNYNCGKGTKKRFYIVYKTYKYLGETFYCVKSRKGQKCCSCRKIAYIEKRTGRGYMFGVQHIMTEKEFKKEMRKILTRNAKAGCESLHKIIENRITEA